MNPNNCLYALDEIEHVMDSLLTFNWFHHRQLIVLLQKFLITKFESAIYSNSGELFQLKEDPNKFAQILNYGTSSLITEVVNSIEKVKTFFVNRLSQASNNTVQITYKTRQSFSNAASTLSFSYIFAISIACDASRHNNYVNNYIDLHNRFTL